MPIEKTPHSETAEGFANHLASIREALCKARVALNEEIGSYPSPTTACDVHFNSLLELRRLVSHTIRDIDAFPGKDRMEVLSVTDLHKMANALKHGCSNPAAGLKAALDKLPSGSSTPR
jgi:hypothetical protein